MKNIVKHNLQLLKQIEKLNCIIAQDEQYLHNIETEYEIVTDQYMNGDIKEPIGKYQDKLMREARKIKQRLDSNSRKLMKLQMKTI